MIILFLSSLVTCPEESSSSATRYSRTAVRYIMPFILGFNLMVDSLNLLFTLETGNMRPARMDLALFREAALGGAGITAAKTVVYNGTGLKRI